MDPISNRWSFAVWLSLLSATACRTRPEELSANKHIAGQLFRPNLQQLEPQFCLPDSHMTGSTEMLAYIRKIFRTITDANPDVFKGDYAPDKFCLINDSAEVFNAYAEPSGLLVFYDKLTKVYPNDGAVASLIGHEVAHVLMQHSAMRMNAGWIESVHHPDLEKNPEWQEFIRNARQENADLDQQIQAAKTNFENAEHKRDQFLQPIRRLLSAPVKELENTALEKLQIIKVEIEKLNDAVNRFEVDMRKKMESDDYRNLSVNIQEGIKRVAAIKIKSAQDTLPYYYLKLDEAQKSIMEIRSQEDEELSKILSQYLGGVLGSKWRDVREEYDFSANTYWKLSQKREKLLKDQVNLKGSQLLGYDYSLFNWMEAEADQVALELVLKAGYYVDASKDGFKAEIANRYGKAKIDECETMLESLKIGVSTELPDRGIISHPSPCWRMINVGYTELKIHEAHYAPWIPRATIVNRFPGEFDRVKNQ
jgi:hypothetical protein